MIVQDNICPVCGEGHLHDRVMQEMSEYKGQQGQTPLYFSECDACGSEQASPKQTRANKRAMMAFRKQVDGLLSGAEVRALREKLGVNQAEATRIFGGGPVAFSKYESDDVAQSEAMDKLLRLAAAVPAAFAHLKHEAGLTINVSGGWVDAQMESSHPKRPWIKLVSSSQLVGESDWKKSA